DADVLTRLGDLVDFVDIDDAALGGLDVKIGGVKQLQEKVFNVLADITGFGEGSGIANGERHVENPSQRPGQKRLTASGRADQQDVALIDFDVTVAFIAQAQALVMVVHGHG